MRYTSCLFLLALILSSCSIYGSSNGKLRYVRSENKEIAVLDKTAERDNNVEYLSQKEIVQEVLTSKNTVVQSTSDVTEIKDDFDAHDTELEKIELSNQHRTTQPLDLNPDEDERIIQEAYDAERAANTSFILLLVGLISAFFPYIGIIPFLIGLIFYSKGDRSRYITQFGERKLRSAKVVMIIDSVILLLWLLLILALIFI
jgi:hypothetical protein